ncbi:MAG: glycine oxidase ThiO, partial [bacterium]|nr:glycine oxidase ThiO [bacterium]
WQLAKAGRDVHLFERDRAGRSASWASAGMLTPLAEVRFQEESLLHLALKSLDLFPDFAAELESDTGRSVGYRRDGVLLVGITRDDVEHLRFRYDYQKELGLPVEWLGGAEAREREPHLSSQISNAVWCPGDHQVDNRLLLDALVDAFQKAGGTLHEETPVDHLEIESDRITGVHAGGQLHTAGTVVLAAGAWSRLIPGLPDTVRPPVRPIRGQILRLQMTDDLRLQSIVWYSRIASSSVAYLAPKDGGHLVLGATSEEMGYDLHVTAGGLFELLRAAWEAVPGTYDLPIVETAVGLRPGSRDDAPILGETPIKGLIMATGHYRKGILLAPITAQNIVHLIQTGQTPAVIRPFGIGRFLP